MFDAVVPIDLSTVFRGYGPLPAVTGVMDQTGAWDAAGQTRTVHLSDGGSIREERARVEPPEAFGYRVGETRGALRLVAWEARGARDDAVVWDDAFVPRAAWLRPVLRVMLRPLWTRYPRAGLRAIRAHADGELGG